MCKFSHSERLKKWSITLDRNFSQDQTIISQEVEEAAEGLAEGGQADPKVVGQQLFCNLVISGE